METHYSEEDFEELCVCSYTKIEERTINIKRYNKKRIRIDFEHNPFTPKNTITPVNHPQVFSAIQRRVSGHEGLLQSVYISTEFNECSQPEHIVSYKDILIRLGSDEWIHVYKDRGEVLLNLVGCKHWYSRSMYMSPYTPHPVRVYGQFLLYAGKVQHSSSIVVGYIRVDMEAIYKAVLEAVERKGKGKRVKLDLSNSGINGEIDGFTSAAFSNNYLYCMWGWSGRMRRVKLDDFGLVEKGEQKNTGFFIGSIIAVDDDTVVGSSIKNSDREIDSLNIESASKFILVLYNKVKIVSITTFPYNIKIGSVVNYTKLIYYKKCSFILSFIAHEEEKYLAINAFYDKKIYRIDMRKLEVGIFNDLLGVSHIVQSSLFKFTLYGYSSDVKVNIKLSL